MLDKLIYICLGTLIIVIVLKQIYTKLGKKGSGYIVEKFGPDMNADRGFVTECSIREADKDMERLHRNVWMTGSTRIDEVAGTEAITIGLRINKDTDKAQKRIMSAAKELVLQ